MKIRWPEIIQMMLCFFWIPSFVEAMITVNIRGPQYMIYWLWCLGNAICGVYFVWIGSGILVIGAYGMYNIIKNVEKNKIIRSAIMLGLTVFNMFGVYYAYQLAELWRYM